MRDHPLVKTLLGLQGNVRPCIVWEPLYGIPYHLVTPFAALYMAALGLSDARIGLVAAVGALSTFVMSLLSGPLVDRFGRRATLLVSDLVSYGFACLLWAFARSGWWFFAATVFNGARRVSTTSWNCLYIEGTDPNLLVHIGTLIGIAGQVSVFFAPLAGLIVARLTLVPAVRILYVFFCACMTCKAVVIFRQTKEMPFGRERMALSRGRPFLAQVFGFPEVFRAFVKQPGTPIVLALAAVQSVIMLVSDTFLALYVTRAVGVPDALVSVFPILTAVAMLAVYAFVSHRVRLSAVHRPLTAAFVVQIVCASLLIALPRGAVVPALGCVLLSGVSMGLLAPLMETLTALHVDAGERARVLGVIYAAVQLVTAPFAYLAGLLSQKAAMAPFLLIILVSALGLFVAMRSRTLSPAHKEALS